MTPADLAQFGITFGPPGLFVLAFCQVIWLIRKDPTTTALSENDPSDEKLNMILAGQERIIANQIKMTETMATISERLAVAAARQEERAYYPPNMRS